MLRRSFRALKAMAAERKPPKDPLIVVLGATGTGKSQLAVDLAKQFNGEIINGDAVQMYDGLPIVTNKITVKEQEGIPHHLLGFIALDEEPWRIGLFRRRASQIIKEIRSRGRLPILVGGTHYYTQSLLFGDSIIGSPSDEESNTQPEPSHQEISERFPILEGPTDDMIARLREVDPVMADRWHPKDRRKIRRSLEIFLTTGKKASDVYLKQKERKLSDQAGMPGENDSAINSCSPLLFWIHAESETLKKRLDDRVDKMVKAGLLSEVKSMDRFLQEQERLGTPVDRARGIWVSIGFKEFEPYLRALEFGTASPEELSKLFALSIEQTQAATRQYAKRQVRWIRLKLIPALKDEDIFDRLYLLDGSDAANWNDAVARPSVEIAKYFLEGHEIQAPQELCPAAKEILALAADGLDEKPDVWFRQTCDLCNITAVTNLQWQTHLKSRRHRGLTKKKQRSEGRGESSQRVGDINSASDCP